MTVTELKKAVKNNELKNLYLFHGEEEYLIFSYVNQFKKLILGDMADFNYFEFEGETSLAAAAEAIEQYPQFAEQKLIILKESGLLKNHDKITEKLLQSIPPYNVVVFVERDSAKINKKMIKVVEEEGEAVDFSRQKPSDLRAWVNIRLTSAGKKMKNDDAEYFVQICELSMSKIELELEKLIASVGDQQEIKRADIERMITPLLDYKIYEMVDCVLKRNAQSAYEMLREFKTGGEAPTVILAMLFSQLHFIAMVKNLKQDQEPKIDEFFPANRKFLAGRIAKETGKYRMEKIYQAMKMCSDFDGDIKMGRIEGWTAVEIVIATLLAAPSGSRS